MIFTTPRLPLLIGTLVLLASSGCSSMNVPAFTVPGMGVLGTFGGKDDERDRYMPLGQGAALASESMSETVYYKTRQAKAENAIVLQISGDEDPLRILPLPPDASGSGSPGVFVSTLLKQTGVHKKLGNIEATLYRMSPEAINGVRMDVQFKDNVIRPETDYALRPGDRLVVKKSSGMSMQSVIDMTLMR